MTEKMSCPACGGAKLTEIYELDGIPVQSVILVDTYQQAMEFPTHALKLKFCQGCGLVFNSIFILENVDYAHATEESQHFSGTFNRFAKKLVSEIAEKNDLNGKLTLEVGCGKGDFLAEMVAQTGTVGLGVDPGFLPNRDTGLTEDQISFRKEYYDPSKITVSPDYVVCRHTLEHIPQVGQFMDDIKAVIGDRTDVGIFFETPDVLRVLAEGAFWDIYYEHCSYFTPGSHARLFRQAGLCVTDNRLDYDDQYIIQHAVPGDGPALPIENDLAQLQDLVAAFPAKIASVRKYWTDFVRDRASAGKRVAIWGGGSKGVSFLTSNGLRDEVAQVVDINPFKQGKFLPVTGHQVVGPDALIDAPPDTVIVMNPIYVPEIEADLNARGLTPEVVAV